MQWQENCLFDIDEYFLRKHISYGNNLQQILSKPSIAVFYATRKHSAVFKKYFCFCFFHRSLFMTKSNSFLLSKLKFLFDKLLLDNHHTEIVVLLVCPLAVKLEGI